MDMFIESTGFGTDQSVPEVSGVAQDFVKKLLVVKANSRCVDWELSSFEAGHDYHVCVLLVLMQGFSKVFKHCVFPHPDTDAMQSFGGKSSKKP